MIKIEIKQTEATKEFLKKYPEEFRRALVAGFRKAMFFLEGEVKKSFGTAGKPKVRTGALRRSIVSSVVERSKTIQGSIGSDLVYAPVQEFGAIIKPKKKPYLRFTIGDRWVTLKQAVIPARPYLYPTINENLDEVDEIVSSEIIGATK